MKPLVSVIIPVYKTEAYLAQCMDSVLTQTYQNIEIILIDDGSPDNCPSLCDDYASKDNRVHVIHKKNGGLSDARNAGKAIATGQYYTFLDSDDILASNAISHMVTLAQKENAQVVKIGVIRKHNLSECMPILKSYSITDGIGALKRIFWDNSQIITSCGKLFDAALFQDLDFPVGRYYEDEYTTPRIYSRANTVVLSDSELYFYMQRDNDSILRGAVTEKKIRDSLFVTEDRILFLQRCGLRKLIPMAVKDHYLKLKKLEQLAAQQPDMQAIHKELVQKTHHFRNAHPFSTCQVHIKQILSHIKHRFLRKDH